MKGVFIIILFCSFSVLGQKARVVINDSVFVRMEGGIFMVLENEKDSALLLTGNQKGGVISEDEDNKIRWRIGDTTGMYVLPFALADSAKTQLPAEMRITSAGTGSSGYVDFSTYYTSEGSNNSPWPSMVTCLYLDDCNFGVPLNWALYFVDRFWLMDAQNYIARPAVTLKLTYRNVETLAPNTLVPANLKAQRFNDGIGEWAPFISGNATVGASTSFVSNIVVPSSDFFAAWAVTDGSTALPVEMSRFEVRCEDEERWIEWETVTEQNNDYFIVQKSSDGISFSDFEKVSGQGTSYEVHQYRVKERATESSYYRIKQVDFDGKYAFSSVKYGEVCNDMHVLNVFPNPFLNQVEVETNQMWESAEIELFNAQGRRVVEAQFTANERIVIDLMDVKSGVYLLHIKFDGKEYIRKITKTE